MDLQEVKNFLATNKEDAAVKAFIAELNPLTADRVKGFLESEDAGKQLFNSLSDSKVTKALATYKENTLPSLVAAEREKLIAELNPKETEEQKQIRLLNEKMAGVEAKAKREALKNAAILQLTKNNLPADLAEKLLGEDEASTAANIELIANTFNTTLQAQIADKFKDLGRKPKGDGKGGEQYFTPEQIKAMSPADVLANLEKVNNSLAG